MTVNIPSPTDVPIGDIGRGLAIPFGIPVVPLEYSMSVPSTMSLSGVTDAAAMVCSKES